MFFYLAILIMVLFSLFHFYFDFRSMYNTGNSIVESFTGGGTDSIQLIGNNYEKPTKGRTLNLGSYNAWDDFVLSFTIRPLGKKRGWQNIIHNTFTNKNCCGAGDRWPAIWFYSNTTRMHIRLGKASRNWNNGHNPTYQLPLNQYYHQLQLLLF